MVTKCATDPNVRDLHSRAQVACSYLRLALPLIVLLTGIGSRVYLASTTVMLHPDEGLHLDTANFPSISALLDQVRVAHPHPPLYFLVLHALIGLSQSLLFHRLFNVALITVSACLLYAWLRRAVDERVALFGIILYFHSPALILVSVQVRGYSLLLAAICGSLYFLHRTLTSGKSREFWAFIGCTAVACLTHYCAFFYLASLAIFAPAFLTRERRTTQRLLQLALASAGFVALYALLWIWHHAPIAPETKRSASTYLARGLYPQGTLSLLRYCIRSNASLLRYLLGQSAWSVVVVLALAALWLGTHIARRLPWLGTHGRVLASSGMVWLLSQMAGILGVYPHYGTRHSIFLLPFLAATVAQGLASLASQHKSLPVVTFAALVGWAVWGSPLSAHATFLDDSFQEESLKDYAPNHLRRVLGVIRAEYRPGDVVVLSTGNNFYFRYYTATSTNERWPRYPFLHLGHHRVAGFETFVEPNWFHVLAQWRGSEMQEWASCLGRGKSVWLASFLDHDQLPSQFSNGLSTELTGSGRFRVIRITGTVPRAPGAP